MAGSGFIYDNRRRLQVLAAKIFPLQMMDKIYTKILCGYIPNLSNPQTFNEKVQWLKLNYFPNNDLVVSMTDKYKVRSVLKKMGLEKLLPELYFVADSADDIPWETLPDKFVIKCNHGCAYNIICSDKSTFDIDLAKKKIKKWLKQDFGLYNIEPHYSKIERKVFAEKFLGNKLVDYKFFCFNGEPKFLYVSLDLAHDSTAKMSYFDVAWNKLPLIRDDYADYTDVKKPDCFDELLHYARILSKPFPFVRADFYVIDETPIFSEMTFTPSAGMMPVCPRHYDRDWGKMIDLNQIKHEG